jgi:hypothetical protein
MKQEIFQSARIERGSTYRSGLISTIVASDEKFVEWSLNCSGQVDDGEGRPAYDKFAGRVNTPRVAEHRIFPKQTGSLKNFPSYMLCSLRMVCCDVFPQRYKIVDGIFVPSYLPTGALSS